MPKSFYVDSLVYPVFSFSGTHMLGNAGMVGDDGEYGSPVALNGLTPEQWMAREFGSGDNWR